MHQPVLTPLFLALGLALGLGSAAQAGTHLDLDECEVHSDYGLRLKQGSVELQRKSGEPKVVRLADGRLWLDGVEQTLSAADEKRVREIEREVGAMMPEVQAIAEEGLDMALDALAHVARSLGDGDPALMKEINRARKDFGEAIDIRMRDGVLDDGLLERDIEALVERLTPQIAGKVASLAITAALSGDEATAKDFERRAEAMGKELEQVMEARGKALEARAEQLCGRIADIDAIENALEFRLADGKPLNLVRM
ncbi:DUF2884 family protein [Pseudomarimonas salicorniae]|uniref:YggN family protein n=1 Tax=Pseudomarimonas salicorniae TaxID=2933270 RepID=A0ABT0GI27_9GAMM|nr:DUF2884 family protein [Lysobacter sp. CAU 1642]MCK7594204.1 YggN family protein [Lysobacter sp. CAU 1642]